jgi:hypothetical protein
MNITFLYKWFWKYKYMNEVGLWQSIICFKYSDSSCFFVFWKAINFVSHFLLLGAKRIVDNGHSINLWMDNWHDDYHLSLQFHLVFAKTKSSSLSIFVRFGMRDILVLSHERC